MIPNLIGNKIDWKNLREYIDDYNTNLQNTLQTKSTEYIHNYNISLQSTLQSKDKERKKEDNIILIEDSCDM